MCPIIKVYNDTDPYRQSVRDFMSEDAQRMLDEDSQGNR